jgi:Flp pilus assembly protein TadD
MPIALAASCVIATCEGDIDSALNAADSAIARAPFDPLVVAFSTGAYSLSGDNAKGLAAIESYRREHPDDIDMLHHLITSLRSAGRSEDAEALLADCERRSPGSHRWFHQRARVAMLNGSLAEAIDLLTQTTQQAPGSYMYWAELGSALAFAKRDKEAEEAAMKSLSICPLSSSAMGVMVRVCNQRGDKEGAAEWTARAAEAVPALSLFAQIRKANAAIKKGDWEAVLELTEPVLSTRTLSIRSNALGQRVRAFLALDRLDEAEATLVEYEGIDSKRREVHEFHGKLEAARGDTEQAIRTFTAGIEKFPTDGTMRAQLIRLLHASGDTERENALAEDVVSNPPDTPWGFSELYQALDETEHPVTARRILLIGKERFPNSEELQLFDLVNEFEKKLSQNDLRGAKQVADKMPTIEFGEVARTAKRGLSMIEKFRKAIGLDKAGPPGPAGGSETLH